MGLGKTLQMLTFLLSEKEEGKTGDELRTLVVLHGFSVYNWKKINSCAGAFLQGDYRKCGRAAGNDPE